MSKLIETIEAQHAGYQVVQCSVTPADDAEDAALAKAVEGAEVVAVGRSADVPAPVEYAAEFSGVVTVEASSPERAREVCRAQLSAMVPDLEARGLRLAFVSKPFKLVG